MDKIIKYFPDLSSRQKEQFEALGPLYEEWNARINVISRKDMHAFYERHVLHSLSIARLISFKNGTEVLDVGTGGGFPGIPLAIAFPGSLFTLIDGIGKKIKVVNAAAQSLELANVEARQIRVENLNESFDFIVSRAVSSMDKFMSLTGNKLRKKGFNELPNGILYLKGGDLREELSTVKRLIRLYPINKYFKEDFFQSKFVVYVR